LPRAFPTASPASCCLAVALSYGTPSDTRPFATPNPTTGGNLCQPPQPVYRCTTTSTTHASTRHASAVPVHAAPAMVLLLAHSSSHSMRCEQHTQPFLALAAGSTARPADTQVPAHHRLGPQTQQPCHIPVMHILTWSYTQACVPRTGSTHRSVHTTSGAHTASHSHASATLLTQTQRCPPTIAHPHVKQAAADSQTDLCNNTTADPINHPCQKDHHSPSRSTATACGTTRFADAAASSTAAPMGGVIRATRPAQHQHADANSRLPAPWSALHCRSTAADLHSLLLAAAAHS
jgi:hypothetical protein